ncbi:MAG: hypothetical protein HYS13_20380 [Planctomycetia bacterium]|nr:hypothetical protein [Planctomycetia bacterium]
MNRLILTLAIALAIAAPAAAQVKISSDGRIIVGVEYVYLGGGKAFGDLKVPLAKPYAEFHEWGAMQKSKDAPIDFLQLDRLIKEYHDAGFTEFYLSLKSNSTWASRDVTKLAARNTVPKEEYWPLYEAWVRAVVTRYGTTGAGSMPGLKRPVRFFEIGTEFSSFQPEPTADYLKMLERGYKTVKAVNKDAIVLHAAFLATTAFRNHPKGTTKDDPYPAAFAAVDRRIKAKGLADVRLVLDHPEWFDALNFHALGEPGEIEDTVAWLKYEMTKRRYRKLIVISDTAPNPLIGWGSAIHDKGPVNLLGVILPPGVEADRPRLAAHFKKLLDKDKAALEWTQAFVATDMVQKVVIASEQDVALVNTSFTEDHVLFQKLLAGEGAAAWAGMAETKLHPDNTRTVTGLRPNFYAIQQLQRRFPRRVDVKRVATTDPSIRAYAWRPGGKPVFVAWLDPGKVFLPGEPAPEKRFSLKVGNGTFAIEPMISRAGQTMPETVPAAVQGGEIELTVTPWPVYVVGQ